MRANARPKADFNSHTREGVTFVPTPTISLAFYFNSHTREGVTTVENLQKSLLIFQLTHPWGCDCIHLPSKYISGISTHTPVRVWLCIFPNMAAVAFNFNSHTREGVTLTQSISASIWAFQLTHPWGCDGLEIRQNIFSMHFNSHTREGVTFYFTNSVQQEYISTHTPVRVWQKRGEIIWKEPNFNSHTREGVTFSLWSFWKWGDISTHTPVRVWLWRRYIFQRGLYFNSHTREGVTHFLRCYGSPDKDFNSHTREGVTNTANLMSGISTAFQLTHPWGCDIQTGQTCSAYRWFQLTHPWGCDHMLFPLFSLITISTHTPVRVWQSPLKSCYLRNLFQLTHPWGCDCLFWIWKYQNQQISTHTPVRVWPLTL